MVDRPGVEGTHTRSLSHKQTHAHMCMRMQCTHPSPHTHAHTHTHTHAHIHTHAYKHTNAYCTRRVASDINTGHRHVESEDKKRDAWVAGTSPFKELKAKFESGTAPPAWALIESRPLLSEAKAATMLTLAAAQPQGAGTPRPGAPNSGAGSRSGAAGASVTPPPDQQKPELEQVRDLSCCLPCSLHVGCNVAWGRLAWGMQSPFGGALCVARHAN